MVEVRRARPSVTLVDTARIQDPAVRAAIDELQRQITELTVGTAGVNPASPLVPLDVLRLIAEAETPNPRFYCATIMLPAGTQVSADSLAAQLSAIKGETGATGATGAAGQDNYIFGAAEFP